ncbi:MAG: 4Fe-4S binding protein [Bacteriovoracaceae bacterium]|nr:4Fe-4S binding protein [Bacteriovoracaceae bacterium]
MKNCSATNVLEVHNKKIVFKNKHRCKKCGSCVLKCPFFAVSIDDGDSDVMTPKRVQKKRRAPEVQM